MVRIRAASAADSAQIAAVQREGWFAAYSHLIPTVIIDRVTVPDGGARVRQSFRVRPWQRMIVAVAGDRDQPGEAQSGKARPGEARPARIPAGKPGERIVGYASYGPETDVLSAPWPHPRTAAGEQGRTGELYALYVHPAWWSTGTGRALMGRVLAATAAAEYESVVLWVLRDNTRARRFYERAGFTPDGATNVLETLGSVPEVRYQRALDPRL